MGKKPKNELRGEMRAVLANLDKRWLQAASRELSKHLTLFLNTTLDRDVRHVLAWISFFPGEADLSSFMDEQLDSRQIYLPRIRDDHALDFVSVGKDWLGSMDKGEFGIPEPSGIGSHSFDPANINEAIVLVPGLAFGRDGSRLGRGKGYYDQFLSRSRIVGVTKIGICWELQLLPTVPTDSNDVHMDFICTEQGIVSCGVGQ